jgi:hypothetical protein
MTTDGLGGISLTNQNYREQMMETLGLLFADGSMLVLPEGTTLQSAQHEAQEADFGEAEPRTRVVRLKIEVTGYVP